MHELVKDIKLLVGLTALAFMAKKEKNESMMGLPGFKMFYFC